MKGTVRGRTSYFYRVILCVLFLTVLLFTRLETARIAPVAACMVLGLSCGMLLLRRSRYLTLPFLLLSLLVIFCYDSYDVFIRYVWLAPVVLVSLTVHLVRLKPRLRLGPSFLPLCAVALATLLGGVGVVSAAEYFTPVALYHTLGLGPLLVLVYLILKNEFREPEDRWELQLDLAALAMTATLLVLLFRLSQLEQIRELGALPSIQWSNNISTLLMIGVPAVFFLAEKHLAFVGVGFAGVLAAVLTGSRGATLLMPVVAAACLLCLWLRARAEGNYLHRIWFWYFFVLSVFVLVSMLVLALTGWMDAFLPTEGEVRWKMLTRSLENFASSPIFGKGLCYNGDADLYLSRKGGINWYHMFVPQVIASLGCVGILAWGWQLFVRARLTLRARRSPELVFGLCYFGLFLMSQVNPGEFCPLPYAFCAVLCFVAIEPEGTGSILLK